MVIIGWTLVLGICAVILASIIYGVVGILSCVADEYHNAILRWRYQEVEHEQDIAARAGSNLKMSRYSMNVVRYIDAPRPLRMRVARELGISESAINRALRYERDGELSTKARDMIMDSGQAVVMNALPEREAIHVCDGTMRQVFGNGLRLIIDIDSGEYRVVEYNASSQDKPKVSGVIKSIREIAGLRMIIEQLPKIE